MVTFKTIQEVWNSKGASRKMQSWLKNIGETNKAVTKWSKKAHQWGNIRFYVSSGSRSIISLRVLGQEVGELMLDETHEPILRVLATKSQKTGKDLKNHERTNKKHFGLTTPAVKSNWRTSKSAKDFRNGFAKLDLGKTKPHSPEHYLEDKLIQAMSERKENSCLSGRAAVKLAKLPLHIPMPIGGNTGRLSDKAGGSIDLLARHERGRRLAVWELKAPGKNGNALIQAYIYACQLLLTLRTEENQCGLKYFRYFRESNKARSVGKKLVVDVVVMVSEDQLDAVRKQYYKYRDELVAPKGDNNDELKFFAACYPESVAKSLQSFDPHKLKFVDLAR